MMVLCCFDERVFVIDGFEPVRSVVVVADVVVVTSTNESVHAPGCERRCNFWVSGFRSPEFDCGVNLESLFRVGKSSTVYFFGYQMKRVKDIDGCGS